MERILVSNRYTTLNTSELHFDPDNPRLPDTLDASNDSEVIDWMLEDAGLIELMGSIATKGYFPAEPLLVMPADDHNGYWVLEGNRRLAAVKLLLEPNMAPRRRAAVAEMAKVLDDSSKLETLPVALFKERSDVTDYLGYRHITGIKQWEPEAKARYLQKLYKSHMAQQGGAVYKYIARLIGSKQDYVKRLLGALELYTRARDLKVPNLGDDISFSLLTLALNYTTIVEFLGLENLDHESFDNLKDENLTLLAGWLYAENPSLNRTALGDSRNMKYLATAVGHPQGVAALSRGATAEDAALATLDPSDMVLRAIRSSKRNLLSAQAILHRVEVTDAVLTAIEETGQIARGLSVLARDRYQENKATDA